MKDPSLTQELLDVATNAQMAEVVSSRALAQTARAAPVHWSPAQWG